MSGTSSPAVHVRTSIVGMGAVSGYGDGIEALWEGLLSTKSCGRIERVDGVDRLIGAVGTDGAAPLSRFRQALFAATEEALADARAHGWEPSTDVGVILAAGAGEFEGQKAAVLSDRPLRARQFISLPPSSIPADLTIKYDLHGPSIMLAAACASANVALDVAKLWLDAGRASDVLVVNAEVCVAREHLDGFKSMRVMFDEGDPLEICRPFSPDSQGFFVGEAATAFVLTNQRCDDRRVELLAAVSNMDGFHPAAMAPDGRCYGAVVEQALRATGDEPVVAVSAHGTGTRLNDQVERAVLNRCLPEGCLVYSTKPLTGHCLSASAGIELVAAALGAARGVLPACARNNAGWDRMADGPTTVTSGVHVNVGVGLGGFNSAVAIRV